MGCSLPKSQNHLPGPFQRYLQRPVWSFPSNLGPHCLKPLVFSSLNGADSNHSCHPLSTNQVLGNSHKLFLSLQSIAFYVSLMRKQRLRELAPKVQGVDWIFGFPNRVIHPQHLPCDFAAPPTVGGVYSLPHQGTVHVTSLGQQTVSGRM